MSIDIKFVAKKADVSISTVSRVLNNSGYASPATRIKVSKIVKELGYRQNKVARSLRKKTSSFVGLIVPDISNEFFSTLAKTIENSLHQNGFSLFLCNTEENEKRERFYIESLLDSQVRGIILASAGFESNQHLLETDIPVIMVDRMNFSIKVNNAVKIESDNYQGAKLAGDILIKKDAKKMVFLRDYRKVYPMMQREYGFIDSMKENEVKPEDYRIYHTIVSPNAALRKIKEIYRDFRFNGLFCGTDTIAFGAVKGLLDMGVPIPEDVQVIGFDGISLGEFLNPPLSTIKQDIETMGYMAGKKILKLISKIHLNEHILLPTEFIERGTTR